MKPGRMPCGNWQSKTLKKILKKISRKKIPSLTVNAEARRSSTAGLMLLGRLAFYFIANHFEAHGAAFSHFSSHDHPAQGRFDHPADQPF